MAVPPAFQELWAIADEVIQMNEELQSLFTQKVCDAGLCHLIHCYICDE